MKSDLIT